MASLVTVRAGRVLRCGPNDLVFHAHQQMERNISQATSVIAAGFDLIDSALNDGVTKKNAVRVQDMRSAVHQLVASARLSGFAHGSVHSKRKMPHDYGDHIRKLAASRSSKVNGWMKQTTKKKLSLTPDSDYTLSRLRASRAMKFEAANSYYRGLRDSFAGTGWYKGWLTSNDEPCEDCDANEEEGVIGVDDEFPSGHLYPLVHLNCGCYVFMRKTEDE